MEIETLDNNGEKQNVLMFSPRNSKNVEYKKRGNLVFLKWLVRYDNEDNELKKCLSFMLDKNIIQRDNLNLLYNSTNALSPCFERILQQLAQKKKVNEPYELAMESLGFHVNPTPNGTASLMFIPYRRVEDMFWIEISLDDKQQALLHACFPIAIPRTQKEQEGLLKDIAGLEKYYLLVVDNGNKYFMFEICMILGMLSENHRQNVLHILGNLLSLQAQ
ncbi:MAG: R.Pab1 family restriction endonuclease [Helicobacter sp.]|nr:R.Pab1 family restriction endonuclease [Helicobacter sp.]